MRTRFFTFFCFLLFFIYLFIVFETDFRGPDEPIYYAYTESVIEDGDLNVVNNIDSNHRYYFPSGVIGVSKTYNLPDFHNHGGVVLWAPFYVYAKIIHFFAANFNIANLTVYTLERLTKCLMSFSTIVFGFFTILLTYMLCRVFFSNRLSIFSTLAICFGTPFFYFLLLETGNANIIASLFSVLSIWAVSYVIGAKKSHWFVYGLFFGICIAVKVDLWFQIFFILPFFIILFINKRIGLINGISFAVGLIPGVFLLCVNNYIKYGTFCIREFALLNIKDSYFLDQLFSSYRGFFYTSPVFYICMLGLILVIVGFLKRFKPIIKLQYKSEDLFILLLSLYLIVKIILLGYRYVWGGGTCGARPLLTEFPILVILYARALQVQKRFIKYCLFFISLIFIAWNLLIISEYVTGVDLKYVLETPRLGIRIKSLENILTSLSHYQGLKLKVSLCLLPMLVILGIAFYAVMFAKKVCSFFWYSRNRNSNNAFKIFCLFAIGLNVSYACITFLNVYNNKKNVERLKVSGFFSDVKILTSRDFERGENTRGMDEMMEYFTLIGDQGRVDRIQRQKEEMYGEE